MAVEQYFQQLLTDAFNRRFAQYTQAPAMVKLERLRKLRLDFVPQTPNSEVGMPDGDVVQQDNTTGFHLGKPRPKIMTGSLIRVQAVYMEKVDRVIVKLQHGIVKASSKKIREGLMVRFVVLAYIFVDLFAVPPSMFFTKPVVYSVTEATQAVLCDTLAEAKIRFTPVRT